MNHCSNKHWISNCEWNSSHHILALLGKTLKKVKSESSYLDWTPAQLFLLIVSATVVAAISIRCFTQRINASKSHTSHDIQQSRPSNESETFGGAKSYAWKSNQNHTKAQAISQRFENTINGESLRIVYQGNIKCFVK